MNRIALLEALRDYQRDCRRSHYAYRQQKEIRRGQRQPMFTNALAGQFVHTKAPYIIHQLITGQDIQEPRQHVSSSVSIRSICCVYHPDEEEGALLLLNLMERLRIRLLKDVVIAGQFELDLEAGLETLIYPDDTAPYYAGELLSTWKLPAVEREVRQWL